MKGLNDISFPKLGIYLSDVPSGINIGNFEIKFYGLLIVTAFIIAYFLSAREAKRTGQNDELYIDCFLVTIIPAIVGARLYYVIFRWDSYKDDLLSILNIRQGGLGVYGGVILGVLAIFIFSRVRKVSFALLLDTIVPSLALGQCIGRWGNFFNREAFGGDSNGLFAMRIPSDYVYVQYSTKDVTVHAVDGAMSYIEVQPTFLYESVLCLLIFIVLSIFRKKLKKVDGEVFLLYAVLYGIGRFVIESFRTDQLILTTLGETPIPVSQVVAALCVVGSIIIFILLRRKASLAFYQEED